MDSTRHAFHYVFDDLSEVERLSTNQASDASPDRNSARRQKMCCSKCKTLPAPGIKLRLCGGWQTRSYCENPCAKTNWADHKRHCERLRGGRDKDLESHQEVWRRN
jgi:hypothetical protein